MFNPQQFIDNGEREFDEKFLKGYNDFSSTSGQFKEEVRGKLPQEFKSFLRSRQQALVEMIEKSERLRAFEILHKYALKTKNIDDLNVIEAAQKEILSNQENT